MTEAQAGYVITNSGLVLVQLPDDNQHGFVLADEDQTWNGGFGVADEWELVPDDDARISDEDRRRLAWVLEEYR